MGALAQEHVRLDLCAGRACCSSSMPRSLAGPGGALWTTVLQGVTGVSVPCALVLSLQLVLCTVNGYMQNQHWLSMGRQSLRWLVLTGAAPTST